MKVFKRRLAAVAAAGVLAGTLAACGDKSGGPAPQQTGEPERKLTFTVATTDTVTSLDPAGPYDLGARTLQANLFQTLLTITADKPTPVPDAADCQYDAPTVYTCSLKSGLTFPNGHELTSSDVKFSFDRMLRLKTPGGAAPLFGSLAAVSTPDELTAVFTLKKPDARLPYLLTTTAASIVDEQSYPAAKLVNDKAVGSGPYQLTAYQPGRSAELTKFKAYRGPRAAQNDGIDLTLVRDSAALSAAVTSGKADLAFHGFGATDLDKLRAGDKVQVVEAPSAEIRYFSFHFKSPVARRPAVRRAVAQLIDRAAIAKKAYADQVTPLYSVVPPGFGGHVEAFRAEYKEPNKAAAAAILREGGVTAPVPLTLGWTPVRYGPGAKAEVTELKRQLDASGLFRVTLRSVERPRYEQLARSGAFDLYHSGWMPDYPDSDDYLAPFVREGALHQNGYKSQTANKLLDQEVAAQNQLERERLLATVQGVVAHDAPLVPSWQGRLTVVAGKDVENLPSTLNALSYVTFSALKK
ncbi:extracellular solute-binding protein family 5 [Kribbella flavida DSM 17836]|uniref:Extracellular solute-binding protein family 5 n=1 Tax=Kribbella flavida (strain DSM 17836 / JCM 10339 / NBRC 14399) TaxID=479435 RepID=D2PPS4_KRIFD|nr:ABC transporter substrate-binding protein [Kribbella flavida]ADB32848.1 extracellular solute-binding protein family 5 [Kribbella flavida DSM 17836]